MAAPATLAAQPASDIFFRVYRDGSDIGFHRVAFEPQGDRVHVDITIEFDVRFAFLTLYSYRHRNREVWDGARVLSVDSRTDDNGDTYRVAATADSGHLIVDTGRNPTKIPGDTLTTTYWHRAFMTRANWLDTQSGKLVRAAVTPAGIESIMADGRRVDADRFRLAGDLDLDIWYRGDDWVKLRFAASDGSTIDYVRERGTQISRYFASSFG